MISDCIDEVEASVVRTLRSGRLFRYDCADAQESEVARLERDFAELVGLPFCLGVNSCSSGLFLALVASGLERGAEVLVPAFTFMAVPSAVVHAGGRPVLVEVTEDFVMDPDDLQDKITPATTHVLVSYMRGRVPDLDRIVDICKRHSLTLIEDTAHSLGVLWRGRQTGSFGAAAAFSTQSHKILDAGEGGLLVTAYPEIFRRALLLAGCYETNWAKHFGTSGDRGAIESMTNSLPLYNFRMSNLSAAALLPQLAFTTSRAQRFNRQYETIVYRLRNAPGLRIAKFLEPLQPVADSLLMELVMPAEAVVIFEDHCQREGVPLSVFGRHPRNARCFWNWSFFEPNECPRTKRLLMRTADLRLSSLASDEAVERLGAVLISAAQRAAVVTGGSWA